MHAEERNVVGNETHFLALNAFLSLSLSSLYTLLQILSVSVCEKTETSCALRPDPSAPKTYLGPNQLNLFDF